MSAPHADGPPVDYDDDRQLVAKPLRVADLPCPKCGSDDDVLLCWAKSGKFGCGCEKCRAAAPEHFDRHCHRCGYDWVTTDMLDAGGPDG